MYAALAKGDTSRISSLLLAAGLPRGRPQASVLAAIARFYTGLQPHLLRRWTDRRSVAFEADRFDAREISVLLAAGLHDTVLRPEQIVAFHEQLTCRSVLLLHVDEHPVLPVRQLATRSGREVWQYARRWLDSELRGLATGVGEERVVVLGESPADAAKRGGDDNVTTPLRLGLGTPSLTGPGRLAGRGGGAENCVHAARSGGGQPGPLAGARRARHSVRWAAGR
ncbi:hypothetical protein ACIA78_30970 [Streptomyces xanthochromogenes]|uniref:hypothetical protein n=1 Tax=Streptomyces xanthochromogenes TaxID=67384 RepID=UPI0037B58DC5